MSAVPTTPIDLSQMTPEQRLDLFGILEKPLPAERVFARKMNGHVNAHSIIIIYDGYATFANVYNGHLRKKYDPQYYTVAYGDHDETKWLADGYEPSNVEDWKFLSQ